MSAAQPITVSIAGIDEVRAAIRAYGRGVETAVDQAVMASALEMLTDVRKQIQGPPKTGAIYKRGKGGKISHRASAPGEAPATDTGALVSSTYITRIGPMTAAIGSRLAYAFHLEFGTWKMEPRPSWMPAAERARPRLEARVARVIARARGGTP